MRFAIFISGGGGFAKVVYLNRNFLTNAEFALVISDRDCPGYHFFKSETVIPAMKFDYECYKSQQNYEKVVLETLREHQIDTIFLNYNRLIGDTLLEAFPDRIFNLHLSLLPLFQGFGALKKAFESNILFYGSTLHMVDKTIDGGPIIGQMILSKDMQNNLDSFTDRHFKNTAIFFTDMIYKIANDELVNNNGKFFFKSAKYGCDRFNPALSLKIEDILLQ